MTLAACSIPKRSDTNNAADTKNAVGDKLEYFADWPSIKSKIPQDDKTEQAIRDIVNLMTLEEKVGQMIQPNLTQVTPAEAKQYKLGSLLNGGGAWPNKNKRSSAKDWVAEADKYWLALDDAYKGQSFRIPFMWATDAVHGHNNVFGATVFPHNIGLGAANDPKLIYRIGQATAKEVAATGLDWTFAPTVAAPRSYRWGRVYEGYSEDPEIIFNYAGKMVEGLQGDSAGLKTDKQVISTVKHWVGDGGTKYGKDRGATYATEEQLINLHATGYFSGLKAGAQVVMSSFNSWHNDLNYAPVDGKKYNKKIHGSKYLITDVLKEKMGFDGIVVTDWNGQSEISGCSAANCPAAVNAGNDVIMVTANKDWKAFYKNVIDQVNTGVIPMDRIDDAVTRILRVKKRAGLWEKPKPSLRSLAAKQNVLGAPEHRKLAREAVRKSLVLLKHQDNVLPLKATQKIYLAGSAADSLEKQTGGWTLTWQGKDNSIDDFPGASTMKSALTKQIGAEHIITDISKADSDTVALIAIGEEPYAEFTGDIKDHQTLGFADLKTAYAKDLKAIRDAKALGMKVVTVFFSGRPMYINEEINLSDAVIAAWLPGTEAGGITDVLYRVNNHDFTGRLAYSWPNTKCSTAINRQPNNIPNYVTPRFEQSIDGEHKPLFPYGYGLSYGAINQNQDLNSLILDDRNYGCRQKSTAAAELPLEVFGKASGGEFQLRISGAKNNWQAIPVPAEANPVDQGEVSVTPINYKGQYDAASVKFAGGKGAQVYVQYENEKGQDNLAYLKADATLQFDIRMIEQPDQPLQLAQHCVYPCRAGFEINKHLPKVSQSWKTIKLPLKCFAANGMNFAAMNTPLLFFTKGKAAFDLGNIRLVPRRVDAAKEALSCSVLGGK
ncbi:1,4-beta-D-glucan glucohydrolase [Leucothrix pacifica]|uniref:1,4-beta-D-glucan glucohydrolase n=2 Tax=Leucothrix pacifica TaxID=1247513 RepID=A0A317C7R1_9GAMM|nr:1,4-beta-D-glucan glucohydrolase [Leucothrix pacifica]